MFETIEDEIKDIVAKVKNSQGFGYIVIHTGQDMTESLTKVKSGIERKTSIKVDDLAYEDGSISITWHLSSSRVEKHIISKGHKLYHTFDVLCFKSKNLYNYGLYQVRQEFISNKKYLNYNAMDKLVKTSDPYRAIPAACSQQSLKLLDQNWKSYFESIKDYSKSPEKYLGRPKLPKYKDKETGRIPFMLTNQQCKIVNGSIKFPKAVTEELVPTKINGVLKQVRIIPRSKQYVLEIVYDKSIQAQKEDNGRYMSIDLGIGRFATVVNNFNQVPIAINGNKIKSENKYYSKQIAHYQEVAERMNGKKHTNKMSTITNNRNNLVNDFLHKASKYIVDYAVDNDVCAIVIGQNKNWKQESDMGKKTNQEFVQMPHARFIDMLTYKCENVGIKLVTTEESYTSGTSFLDGELPNKENYDKSRRKHRGLFQSSGKSIHADVNGSYQIMKKVFPDAHANGIEGAGLHPIIVDVI